MSFLTRVPCGWGAPSPLQLEFAPLSVIIHCIPCLLLPNSPKYSSFHTSLAGFLRAGDREVAVGMRVGLPMVPVSRFPFLPAGRAPSGLLAAGSCLPRGRELRRKPGKWPFAHSPSLCLCGRGDLGLEFETALEGGPPRGRSLPLFTLSLNASQASVHQRHLRAKHKSPTNAGP